MFDLSQQEIEEADNILTVFCLKLVYWDRVTALDIKQEAWFRALKSISDGSYKPQAKFSTYLCQIARNYHIDEYRRSIKKGTQVNIDEYSEEFFITPPDPDFDEKPLAETLHSAVSQLNPKRKRVIELKYLDGYKCSEIAEMLNVSEMAVRALIFHGRRDLASLLKDVPVSKRNLLL